jgi:HKD family nuclease
MAYFVPLVTGCAICLYAKLDGNKINMPASGLIFTLKYGNFNDLEAFLAICMPTDIMLRHSNIRSLNEVLDYSIMKYQESYKIFTFEQQGC